MNDKTEELKHKSREELEKMLLDLDHQESLLPPVEHLESVARDFSVINLPSPKDWKELCANSPVVLNLKPIQPMGIQQGPASAMLSKYEDNWTKNNKL